MIYECRCVLKFIFDLRFMIYEYYEMCLNPKSYI